MDLIRESYKPRLIEHGSQKQLAVDERNREADEAEIITAELSADVLT